MPLLIVKQTLDFLIMEKILYFVIALIPTIVFWWGALHANKEWRRLRVKDDFRDSTVQENAYFGFWFCVAVGALILCGNLYGNGRAYLKAVCTPEVALQEYIKSTSAK